MKQQSTAKARITERGSYDFHETIADIAYMAGAKRYYGGDSRQDINDFIDWAHEFADAHKDTDWDDGNYMEAIEEFTTAKLVAARLADTAGEIVPDPALKLLRSLVGDVDAMRASGHGEHSFGPFHEDIGLHTIIEWPNLSTLINEAQQLIG